MQSWATYLWVATGGALGSVGRHWLTSAVAARFGDTFPWGTLLVNITGSVLIGFLAALPRTEGHWLAAPAVRHCFMAGVCGGYTTFSAFSLQTLSLMQAGKWLSAGGNVILSVLLCLVGVWLGYLLGAALNTTKTG